MEDGVNLHIHDAYCDSKIFTAVYLRNTIWLIKFCINPKFYTILRSRSPPYNVTPFLFPLVWSGLPFSHDTFDAPPSLAFCTENPSVTGGFPSQRASNAESVSMQWRFWLTLKKASNHVLMTICEWNQPVGCTAQSVSNVETVMQTHTHTHTHTCCVNVFLKLLGRVKHHVDFTTKDSHYWLQRFIIPTRTYKKH